MAETTAAPANLPAIPVSFHFAYCKRGSTGFGYLIRVERGIGFNIDPVNVPKRRIDMAASYEMAFERKARLAKEAQCYD